MPTVVATDDFTTSVDEEIETYSTDWIYCRGDEVSNQLTVIAADDNVEGDGANRYNVAQWQGAGSIDSDHYSQVLVTSVANANYYGAAVRCQGEDTGDAYLFSVEDSSEFLSRIDAGSETVLSGGGGGDAGPVTVRLEVVGSSLEGFFDAVSQRTATDSTHTDGAFGVSAWQNGSRLDDFEGGNMADALSPGAFLQRIEHMPAPNPLLRM